MFIHLLFRNKRFRPLFWVQFLGALNDNFLKNALVVLIEYQGLSLLGLAPPLVVAMAGAIFILPFFLFSMIAGQIADRNERSRVVRWVKVWELLITIIATVGFVQHNIYLLLGALFMMGTHSAFFGPIKYGSIPDLVPPERMVAANAYIETGTFVAILLGTIGGGLLISMNHGEFAIGVAIVACALFGIFASRKLPLLPSYSPDLEVNWNPVTPMRENLRMIRARADVWHAVLGISWFWFFGAALLSILPPYCKEFLKVNEHVITAFLTMFTLGIGIGSIICERLSKERVVLALVPVGALGMTVFLFDLCRIQFEAVALPVGVSSDVLMTFGEFWNADHGPRLLLDFMLLSVFGGIFALPLYTAMQQRSDRTQRSRVVAGNNVLNSIFIVAASLMVMAFHALGYSVTETLVALGVLNALVMLYLYWSLPEFRTLGQWWQGRK